MEFLFESSLRSLVRHEVEHEKRNSISNHTLLFCLLYKHTENEVFDDFPTTFQRFPKILQKLSEGHKNVCEDFQRKPKIAEDFRGRTNELYTPTNLTTLQW